MNRRPIRRSLHVVLAPTLCVVVLGSGCWWQKEAYTKRMVDEFSHFEKRAELDRLLGEPFQPAGDFRLWLRPPKMTQLVRTPEQFIAWFQGSDVGTPLTEVIIIGSMGQESSQEFQQTAFDALKATGHFPAETPERNKDPQEFASLHDGKLTFDLYQASGKRQIQSGGTSAGEAVDYQWLIYIGEETPQKIMVCFIVPDKKYAEFWPSAEKCLQSIALGGKVAEAAARGGTSGL